MKRFRLTALLLFAALSFTGLSAQMDLTITLDVSQMTNVDCNLNGGVVNMDKVYLHSGLCTSGASYCMSQVTASGSTGWEHVVGNWGMDDGIGEMSYQGNGVWSIQMIVENYFSNPSTISSGSTVMPNGATPYTMGIVFRSDDGTYEGKDDLCNDIFIVDLQGNPRAVNSIDQTNFTPVSVSKATGIEETGKINNAVVYPNPAAQNVHLDYYLRTNFDQITVRVFNQLGQEVATVFEGPQSNGQQSLVWDVSELTPGLYSVMMDDGAEVIFSEKLIVNQ